MKRRIALLAAAFTALGGGTAMAADITYTGANGAWSEAANWSLGRVPVPGDTVIIPAPKQVTLAAPASVAGLQLAGTITGAGDLTVGSGTWSGGAMAGTGTTRVTGTFKHTANTTLNDTRVLAVEGTLEMAGGYINKSGTPVVRNIGTIKRTAASAVQIHTAIDNDGVIDGVELDGGGTGSTGAFSGVRFSNNITFELADGATLNQVVLAGATLDVAGTVTASGTMSSGTVTGAGTLHVNGPFTWSGGTMSGTGTTRVTSTMTHAGNSMLTEPRVLAIEGTLNMAGGYINKTGAPLVRNTGTITRTAATETQIYAPIDNDGRVENVTLEGGGTGSTGEFAGVKFANNVTFGLDEGTRLVGVTLAGSTLNATGVVTAGGATTLSSGTLGGAGTFVLGGATTWSGGAMTGAGVTRVTGVLTHTANTALSRVLAVEGTLDSAKAINGSGGAAIHVTGTLQGGGTTTAAVENDGVVKAFELGGGGRGVSSGEFAGSTLKAGTFELSGGKLTGNAVLSGATLGGTVNVVAARMTGGTLGAATDVSGSLEWTGGKVTGATRVPVGGTMILNGISSLGGVLENRGLIDLRGSAALFRDGSGRVENLGTIRKTAGTTSTIGAPLRNAGTVDGAVGELRVEDGTDEPDTGTFTGVVFVGERTFTGAVSLPGTVEFADDITVRAGDTVTVSGTGVLRAGTLRGNLSVSGRLTWDGGRQAGPGTTTVTASGRIVVTPLAAFGCGSASLSDGRTLINNGLLRLEKGADLSTFGGGSIVNAGRIELETTNDDACGASSGINGDAVLRNTGTIAKTGGTSPSHLRLVVDNDGTINGPLEVESDETVTHTGTFKDVMLGDGVLVVDGATLTGTTEVAGGELRVLRPVTVATLRQTGGVISGTGLLTVTGSLVWSDGDQRGPGTTAVAAGAVATISDNVRLDDDRELRNAGTLTVDDATLFLGRGASIRNGGTLVLDGTAELEDPAFAYGFGEAGLVHNTGTLRKTGTGVAAALASIDNDGAIEILDGRLELRELLNWSGPLVGGAGTLAGGTYVVGNGASLLLPGALKVNAARLALHAGSQVLYNEFTGTGVVARDALGGLLRNAAGGVLELAGGRALTVAGTFANQGVLALGAGSVLNAGGFTQAAGAVLRPTVTAAASGRVAAVGAVHLGGRLDVVAPAPVGGDVSVVTGAVAGTFAAVTGEYVPTYGGGGVTVRRSGGGEVPKTPAAVVESPLAAVPAFTAPAAAKPAAKASKPKVAKKPAKKAKKKTKKPQRQRR